MFRQGILAQKEQVSLEENGPADGWWDGESGPITFGRPEVKVVANGVSRFLPRRLFFPCCATFD